MRRDKILQVDPGIPLNLDNFYDLKQAICLILDLALEHGQTFTGPDQIDAGAIFNYLLARQSECVCRSHHLVALIRIYRLGREMTEMMGEP